MISMDISAPAGEPGALQDARKQRYFLPLPDDNTAALEKSDNIYIPDVHHGPGRVTGFYTDISLDTSTTPATPVAGATDAHKDRAMPSAELVIVASPAASDSNPSTPASPEHNTKSAALPSKSTLARAADLTVNDAQGQAISFNELYRAEPGQRRRVMILFIRHFFCGNCQEFIRALVAQIPPASLPADTSLAIIGCGSYTLIPSYIELTSCPYPIYADSTKKLFDVLGMQRTLSLGWHAPNYIHHSLATGVVKSIVQGVKRIPAGDVMKAGDLSQNGGEYMFEVEGAETRNTRQEHGYKSKGNAGLTVRVTFCHRMQNTRDHTEIPQLVELLGLSESNERSRRVNTRLERRRTPGEAIGNLARSLSNTRQGWLERRNSSGWSKTRKRDRSESSDAGDKARRSRERIEMVREDVHSREGLRLMDETNTIDAIVSTNSQETNATEK